VLLLGAAALMAITRVGPTPGARAVLLLPALGVAGASGINLVTLAGVFLKAGALLYGSGYVLIAFLRGDLVDRLGWLTDAQLLDAVAIGQVTPGPLFTTATFIGFVLAGIPGAVVATIAIFLPAFLIVALIAPWIERIRDHPGTAALLDGVNAAAIGLMAAVALQLGLTAIHDPLTAGIGLVAGLALLSGRVPSVILVAAGAAVGLTAAAAGIGP
jgi:chromate transporter